MNVKKITSLYLFYLFIVLMISGSDSNAAVYYIDSSGNDSNNGLTELTPWRTIAKVNLVMPSITAGSQILFKRGDTFYGGIVATKSQIIFGSYGSGNIPVISGTKIITGWTNDSGNIYSANFTDTVSHLYINGKLMTIARYPNSGFLKIDNANSTTSFFDAELTQSNGYWNQANCRVRTANWCYETRTVSNFSGGYITLSPEVQNTIYSKSGYYFDNKLSLLDAENEWYHDKAAGKIYLYAPGGINPNSISVEAVIIKYGFYLSNSLSNVIVQDLKFSGFRDNCIEMYIATNIIIQRCALVNAGKSGIRINGSNNIIDNNFLEDNLNTALTGTFTNCTVINNSVNRTGLIPGYGENAWGHHGMQIYLGYGTVCQNNIIDSTGYTGMIGSKNMTIKNNIVSYSCLTLNDGGGIDIDDADGLQLLNNIVTFTIGNVESSSKSDRYANGIYFGPNITKNILIKGNTLAFNNYSGINVDNKPTSANNRITDNIFYNNGYTQLVLTDYSASSYTPVYSNVIKNNIFYSLSYSQICMEHQMFNSPVFSDYGDFDSNYYCNPYSEFVYKRSMVYGTYKTRYYRLSSLKSLFNEDLTSNYSQFTFDQYKITDTLSGNLILNPRFTSNLTNWSTTPSGSFISWVINSLLDTGCMKIRWNGAENTESMTSSNFLSLVKGNFYSLSLSYAGNHTGDFSVFGRPISGSNPPLFAKRYLGYENYRKNYSVIFKPDTTDLTSRITFAISKPDSVVFIDNVYLHQVNTVRIDSTLKNKLYINSTSSERVFSLGSESYKNPDGSIVTGSITLLPFTSRILINDSEVLQKHLLCSQLIQGLYNPVSGKMKPDTVRIYLRNSSSPYSVIDSAKSVSDSTGSVNCFYSNILNGINYYISVIHRNSIETWSSNPISFISNEAAYNFTNSSAQAYGGNLILSGTKYCLYSGDVNQDGIIDGTDMTLIDNDAYSSATGYLSTDVNGDNVTDGSDLQITDNNAFNNVSKVTP